VRKSFFERYKEIEALWEILSPDAALRDHIPTYKQLSQLYAAVRNAYAEKVGFVADLAYKTRRLIEESAEQHGLGRLTKSVTFDVATLKTLRGEGGSDEGKVFNLVRGLQHEIDEDPAAAPVLQPLKDRAERILKDLEDRKTTGLAAMDLLASLAAEKETAMRSARDSGLTSKAFGIFWALKSDTAMVAAGLDAMVLAKEAQALLARFPNAPVNADEQRRLRASMYKPLLALSQNDRARVVELVVRLLLSEREE
jgi:type I restriction enzyme R subunit